MKTKTIKNKDTGDWALPGDPLSINEFKTGIKDAEKGPFFTIEESKKILKGWRSQKHSR